MLDLYERETDEALARAPRSAVPEVGVFDGFLRGTGLATVRQLAVKGFATPLQQIGAIGAIAYDRTMDNWYGTNSIADGTSAQDRYFRATDEWIQSAIDRWTPKPYEVGVAGEIAGTLIGLLPLAIASPPTAVAGLQLDTARELATKGVDNWRAQAVGAAQAAGFGVGIWMPFLGSNLWQRMAVGGAGANVLQGVLMRGAAEEILRGHPAAEAFKALDPTEITLDVILGLAFGAAAHYIPSWRAQSDEASQRFRIWAQNITPQEVAALAALRQAQHSNKDSLPGAPAAPADLEAHVTRLKAALEQLERGADRVEVQGIGRPVEDAPATPAEALETPGTSDIPVARDGAATEVVANGAYRDGGNWRARYSTEERTDGTFALVRTITDSDGEQTAHLTKDGEWRKGLPSRTAAMGAHAEETGAESFPTPEYAMAAANDDANSMGAARAVEAQDAAAAATAETRETGPSFEPDPARLQEMARRAEELVAEAGRIRTEEQLRVELPTDPAPVPAAERSPFLPEGVDQMAHPQQARRIAEAIEARLREVGDPPERARANAAIWEARMRTRAERYGQSPAEWMRSLGLEIEAGPAAREGALGQQPPKPILDRTPTGQPELVASDVALARSAFVETRDGRDIVEHLIVDPKTGKATGRVTLAWKGDKADQLLWINTIEGERARGMAEATVRAILEQNGDTPLHVAQILRSARGFWEKMGVEIFETETGQDGTATLQTYRAARARRQAARAGTETAPGTDAGGTAAAEGAAGEAQGPRTLEQRQGPRWVSELSRQIEAAKMTQAPAKGWKDFLRGLKGVKADEIKWSGIEEWLDLQQGKVTKDQVLGFLRENGVKVEEVELGTEAQKSEIETERANRREELAREDFGRGYDELSADERARVREIEETEYGIEGTQMEAEQRPGTKYSQYQLPGAKEGSYRELLLTLPHKYSSEFLVIDGAGRVRTRFSTRKEAEEFATVSDHVEERQVVAADFESSHFDEPNILAHVRFNERTDADGKRVLFIEEIQSDWAQKGKKEGFAASNKPDGGGAYSKLPPQAPFVGKTEAWVALTMKRMIRYAAENGFERIAWTRGEQQVDRYTSALRKAVDAIEWTKTPEGVQLVGYKGKSGTRPSAEDLRRQEEGTARAAEAADNRLREIDRVVEEVFGGDFRALIGEPVEVGYKIAEREHGIDIHPRSRAMVYLGGAGHIIKLPDGQYEVPTGNMSSRLFGAGELKQAEKYLWQEWLSTEAPTAPLANRSINPRLRSDIQLYEGALDVFQGAHRELLDMRARAKGPRGTKVVDTTEREDALSDAIGKAMADRILNDPAQSGTIEGENIKVDDTGMATFYDRIVPNVAKDILKKLGGGKVTEANVEIGDAARPPQVRTANYRLEFDEMGPMDSEAFAGATGFRDGGDPLIDNTAKIMINGERVEVIAMVDPAGLHMVGEGPDGPFELLVEGSAFPGWSERRITQDQALNKVLDGWDSELMWENVQLISGEVPGAAAFKGSPQPAFDITPELRDRALQGMTLFQPAKGQITFADNRTIIDLFETADASTFQHETGHLFLQDIRDIAMGQNATRQALEDWGVLANWLGNEGGDITRAQHEQFARGWERYLAEGIAPSVELRSIFAQFKEWLLNIYRKLRGLDVELSPEVRSLFDRMLATDAEIAQARSTETDGPPAQRADTVEPPPPPGEAGPEAGPARPEVPSGRKEATMTMKQLREATKPGPFNLRREEARAEIERREKAGEAAFGREVFEMTDAQLKKVVEGGRKFRKSLKDQALAEMKLRAEKEAALTQDMTNPDLRAEIERMGTEAGWAQVGGKLADQNMRGKVSISKWIPRADWWTRRPDDMNEAATKETVRKMLAGEPLRAAEKRMAVFLVDEAKGTLDHFQAVPEPEAKAIAEDWAQLAPEAPATPKDVVDADLVAAAADLAEGRVERAAQMYENDDAAFMAEIRSILDEHAQDQATPRGGEEGQRAPEDEANALIHAYDRAQREAELAPGRDEGEPDRTLEGEPEGEAPPNPMQVAAMDLVAQNPNRLVRVGTTPEGEPMLVTMEEYLRGALEDARAAREDIALMDAAATCLLGRA